MSFSFALSSIKSLGTTWADENIDVGEKLLQTFMSFGMAIPMVMNGVKGLTSAYQGSATIQAIVTAMMQKHISLGKEELATLTAK
jgi:hypothetical protein